MKLAEYQEILLDDQAVQKMIQDNPVGWNTLVKRIGNQVDFYKDQLAALLDSLVQEDKPETRYEILEARMLVKALLALQEIPTELRQAVQMTQEALREQGEDIFDQEGKPPLEAIKP